MCARMASRYGNANPWVVLTGVTVCLGVSAIPLYFKKVRERELQLAEARCVAALCSEQLRSRRVSQCLAPVPLYQV